MLKIKTSISLDSEVMAALDTMVQNDVYPSRSAALEAAVRSMQAQELEQQYCEGLALLSVQQEQQEAEWGMSDYSQIVGGVGDGQ